MAVQEHDSVVLTASLPSVGLEAGDVGVVVHVHSGGKAFEVEFLTLGGRTIAVETLRQDQIRPVREHEIPHVREMTAA